MICPSSLVLSATMCRGRQEMIIGPFRPSTMFRQRRRAVRQITKDETSLTRLNVHDGRVATRNFCLGHNVRNSLQHRRIPDCHLTDVKSGVQRKRASAHSNASEVSASNLCGGKASGTLRCYRYLHNIVTTAAVGLLWGGSFSPPMDRRYRGKMPLCCANSNSPRSFGSITLLLIYRIYNY